MKVNSSQPSPTPTNLDEADAQLEKDLKSGASNYTIKRDMEIDGKMYAKESSQMSDPSFPTHARAIIGESGVDPNSAQAKTAYKELDKMIDDADPYTNGNMPATQSVKALGDDVIHGIQDLGNRILHPSKKSSSSSTDPALSGIGVVQSDPEKPFDK